MVVQTSLRQHPNIIQISLKHNSDILETLFKQHKNDDSPKRPNKLLETLFKNLSNIIQSRKQHTICNNKTITMRSPLIMVQTWLGHHSDISWTWSKHQSVITTSCQTKHNHRSSSSYGDTAKPLRMPCEAVTKPQKTTYHHVPKGQPMMTQRWTNIILQPWLWRKRQGQTMVKQWMWQKNKLCVQRFLIWQKRQKQNENELHNEQHPNTNTKRLR